MQQFLMSFECFKADPAWRRIQQSSGRDWSVLYTEFHDGLRETEDVSPEDIEVTSEYYDRAFVTPIGDLDTILSLKSKYEPFTIFQ